MIKVEEVEKDGKKGVQVDVSGNLLDILHQYAEITETLVKNVGEPIVRAAFKVGSSHASNGKGE